MFIINSWIIECVVLSVLGLIVLGIIVFLLYKKIDEQDKKISYLNKQIIYLKRKINKNIDSEEFEDFEFMEHRFD